VVKLCSGVSLCGSDAKKWRIFKKFGKGKFVKVYILQIPKILYGTVLCFFLILIQKVKDNVERFPSSSRLFYMFFYA